MQKSTSQKKNDLSWMAPKPTSLLLPKSRINRKNANAAGFAKRQLRKATAAAAGGGGTQEGADVYEYSSGRNKRSGITLSLDKDEEYGAGKKNLFFT